MAADTGLLAALVAFAAGKPMNSDRGGRLFSKRGVFR